MSNKLMIGLVQLSIDPFEGWAMAGYNMKQLHLRLRRLIVMRDEKLLDQAEI